MNQTSREGFSHSLVDDILEITIFIDSEGIVGKVDEHLSKLIGYPVKEISGTPLVNYVKNTEQEMYQKKFQEVLNGKPVNINSYFIHNKGESIPVQMILIPSTVEGKITGVIGFVKSEAPNKSSNIFRTIAEDALDGVYILQNEQLMYGNPYLHQLLGTKYPEEHVNILHFIHPEDLHKVRSTIESLTDGAGITHFARVIRKDGSQVNVEIQSKLINMDKEPMILGTVKDITEREVARERIYFLSYYDELTELPNRKSFEETLEKEMIIAKTLHQGLSIMYLDLDRFKQINDALGRDVGDELLRAISKRILMILGDQHQLFRVSGDEFAIISSSIDKITHLANQIIRTMAEPFLVKSNTLYVTTSIGISFYPKDGESISSLLKKADAALQHAKNTGKNNVKIYASTMDIQISRAFQLESDFRSAFEEGQLEFYFQPKVRLENSKIIGAEAFVKWNHPKWGLLSSEEFFPIIKNHHLLETVVKKMTKKLIIQIKEWQKRGLPPIPVSTNLLASQLMDESLVSAIQEVMIDTKLDPEFFEMEFTETFMFNEEVTLIALRDLQKTGITITLDDFGTGQSSLSYLTKFKNYIHAIKIDRSFIASLSIDTDTKVIIEAMLKLAEVLRMQSVAVGVETYEQLQLLQEAGCKIAQGDLFSKPLPATMFEKLLKNEMIHISFPSKGEGKKFEESRDFFRIPLYFPLSGTMTLTRINGRTVETGQTKVLIEDIGLGGLRFLSDLKLTVNPNIILEFETNLFGEPIKLIGSIVWAMEIKTEIYQYGLKFTIDDQERSIITPVLNKLAIKLRKAPLVPDCSFVTEDRYVYMRSLRK